MISIPVRILFLAAAKPTAHRVARVVLLLLLVYLFPPRALILEDTENFIK